MEALYPAVSSFEYLMTTPPQINENSKTLRLKTHLKENWKADIQLISRILMGSSVFCLMFYGSKMCSPSCDDNLFNHHIFHREISLNPSSCLLEMLTEKQVCVGKSFLCGPWDPGLILPAAIPGGLNTVVRMCLLLEASNAVPGKVGLMREMLQALRTVTWGLQSSAKKAQEWPSHSVNHFSDFLKSLLL